MGQPTQRNLNFWTRRSRVAISIVGLIISLIGGLMVLLVGVISPALTTQFAQAEVFDQAWQTVKDNFYDPKFNGVDWQAMRQKYRSQAAKAQSVEALSDVINQMLAELKTSHTRFYNPTEPAYYQLAGIFQSSIQAKLKPFLANGKLEYTGVGIFTKTTNQQTFIQAILNGSPAEKAGLKVGDRILSVDNQPFRPIQSFIDKAGKPVQFQIQRMKNSANTQAIVVTPQRFDPNKMFLDAMKNSTEIIEQNGKK